MFSPKTRLPLLALAATLMTATAAQAGDSAWTDQNCLFRSAVAPKGGEATRTSIYKSDQSTKSQWCSPTTRNDVSSNDTYNYNHQRIYNPNADSNLAPAAGY